MAPSVDGVQLSQGYVTTRREFTFLPKAESTLEPTSFELTNN